MILRSIDNLLNRLTMYKTVSFSLAALTIISLLLSALGILQLPLAGMAIALGLLMLACYVTNTVLSRIWQIPANSESSLITAFILFFILPQVASVNDGLLIFIAGTIAIASKYIIAWRGKHLFNPAAFGAVAVGLPGLLYPSWWIGSSLLWPAALVIGLLIVRKIRRFPLVLSFGMVSIAVIAVVATVQDSDLGETMRLALIASPLIFLGTVMLTEPITTPPLRHQQVLLGVLVGLLYGLPIKFGDVPLYPELALLIGNTYAYAVSPKYRLRLQLKKIEKISSQVYSFIFTPNRKLNFQPGQYLEWTLGHAPVDIRGNRRTFTIASSPTEPEVRLGVKFYEPSSSFKKALLALKLGSYVYASGLAGNFTLPSDQTKKLAFIAGGIGITPFRSMLRYLIDTGQKRDITVFYLVSRSEEVAYREVLDQAAATGIKIIIMSNGEQLDTTAIKAELPDFADRTFYISGPNRMVGTYAANLRSMQVPYRHIKTDYFSGY